MIAKDDDDAWPLTSARLERFDPRWASAGFFGLLAVALGWAGWAAAFAHFAPAIAMAGVAVFALLLALARARIPSLFRLAFVAAALVSTAVYTARWWREANPMDESIHLVASWAMAAGLAWVFFGRTRLFKRGDSLSLFVAAIATGLTLGLLWEAMELAIGMDGRVDDMIVDLLMDLLGSIAAGASLAWAAARARPPAP